MRATKNDYYPVVADASWNAAQSFTLLYRRLAVDSMPALSSAAVRARAMQIENLRYSRVKLRAARISALGQCKR